MGNEAVAICDTEVFMKGIQCAEDFVTTIGACCEKYECLVQNTLDSLGVGVSAKLY